MDNDIKMKQDLEQTATRIEQALIGILRAGDTPHKLKLLIIKLKSILGGERNPALADDPNLDYDDAAELQLLLEELNSQ